MKHWRYVFKKMTEDFGKVTGYAYTLSPKKGDTLQIGSIMINEGEKAICESLVNDSRVVVTHVVMEEGN